MSRGPDERGAELRALFFESSAELLQALNEDALKLEKQPGDGETVRSIRRIVHTLKGDAAATGFQELSEVAHKLEDVLASETTAGHGSLAEIAFRAADLFSEMLSAYRGETKLPSSAPLQKMIRDLARLPKAEGSAAKKGKSSSAVQAVWTEYEKLSMQRAANEGKFLYHIRIQVDPTCAMPIAARQLVLKALADQCVRATFFSIGKHATYYPDILRKVVAGGHTVGTHTWSHIELEGVVKTKGLEAAEEEFEKGASAVPMMAGTPIAPFFRFPELRHPNEMLTYLGERNVAIFSADVDSWDFRIKKPEELTKSLMGKVRKAGKGIILMHDFQKVTSIALPQILAELQRDGFKVVHMVPKETLGTLPQFDEAVQKEIKMPVVPKRPQEAVVRTLNQ